METLLAPTVPWGADPASDIQAALDKAGSVVLKAKHKPWIISKPLEIRSNTKLVLEPGVELLASEDGFRDRTARLLNIKGVHDVEISGAGATVRMQRALYLKWADSQHRHAIRVVDSERIHIHGSEGKPFLITESGGDGIYIGGGGYGPSRDLTIRHVWSHRHYREGIGVMSVDGCLIEHCRMTDTRGDLPGCGLDIEPNCEEPLEPPQKLRIVVRDCEMSGNAGGGFYVNLSRCNPGLVVDVRLNRCVVRENSKTRNVPDVFCDGRDRDYGGGDGKYPTGLVLITNCRVIQGKPEKPGTEEFGRWGLYVVGQEDVNLNWIFVTNTWESPNGLEDEMLRVRLPRVEKPNPLGGVLFIGCQVDDGPLGPRSPIEVIPYRQGTTGVYNIRGTIRYSYDLALPPGD